MAGVTLTAAMRANLYSLQQTSQLMGTIQNRLSTGKKVNSALDNPNNYFSAASLTNRATDLSNLLDGMGQAIQAITTASNSITSAQKLVDQMKAVANSAIQSATTSAGTTTQPVVGTGTAATTRLMTTNGTFTGSDVTTAGASSGDSVNLLTNLTNNNGVNLGLVAGDLLTVTEAGSNATVTFTVTATSTMKDLQTKIEGITGAVATLKTGINAAGNLVISGTGGVATTNDLSFTGTAVAKLGLSAAVVANGATAVSNISTNAIGIGPFQITGSDKTHELTALTNSTGTSLGISNGDTLTYKMGTGQTLTFTVGASNANNAIGKDGGGTTLNDLQAWIGLQNAGALTTTSVSGGKLTVTNADTTKNLVLGGTLATELGVNGTVASNSGSLTGSVAAYVQPQSAIPVATTSTLLRDLTSADGKKLYNGTDAAPGTGGTAVGDTVTIKTWNGTTGAGSLSGLTTITITEGMTVQNLLDKINAVDPNLKAALDGTGHITIDNQTAGDVQLGGTAQGLFEANTAAATDLTVNVNLPGAKTTLGVVLSAGYAPTAASSGSGAIDAASAKSFDTLRTQLDQLINDSSYQGINLISGTTNSPLTVTFDEKAVNAASLVINAVDLTSKGLGLTAASGSGAGAWVKTTDVQASLVALTTAATTLRTQSASLGTNLSTVQTRQDFTNNMIATLKAGSDSLTLADMNEESANMLALQTRSQLGTQALSLANQANQSVMRLFG